MASAEWLDLWQLGVVRGVNSFQLYGGSGARERHRGVVESEAVATAAFLCRAGNRCGIFWLHHRFRPSAPRRLLATGFSNAVESPDGADWVTSCPVIPDSVGTRNGHGLDAAGADRRSAPAPRRFWTRHRCSLRLEHTGRGGRCSARRRLPRRGVWASRHRPGCGFGELPRRRDSFAGGKRSPCHRWVQSGASTAAAPASKLSAALAFALRQSGRGWYPSLPRSGLVPVFALVCRFFVNRFFRDACGCPGGNWIGQHRVGHDSSPHCAGERVASRAIAPGRDYNASLVPVLPRGGPNARRSL